MSDHRNQPRAQRRRPLVGAQIRRLRTERGMTLAQVSEQSGLNVGYLSQVETDKASPSLETLAAISGALDVPVAWCLLDAAPPPRVVRRADRQVEELGIGLRIEDIDGGHARDLRMMEVVLPPGTSSSLTTDAGQEHHVVLDGEVRLTQGTFCVDLGPGDYVVWDGTFPHEGENIGASPARVLIVTAGQSGLSVSAPSSAAKS